MARKLRIAASVSFAVVAVGLFVLWVRTTYLIEDVESDLLDGQRIVLQSQYGRLGIILSLGNDSPRPARIISFPIKKSIQPTPKSSWALGKRSFPGSGLTDYFLAVPYWLLVVLSGTLAVAPWIKWSRRFRIRTLLLVMAIIAVMSTVTTVISGVTDEPMAQPPPDVFG